MSLRPHVITPVPEETARVARAAFPKGQPYLTFRDALGIIFQDEDFTALFPAWGQPALPPWRLALVTIMQFRENLADRQAAEAVRARIDWKYLLSLDLTDPGFDFSVLSEFRDRLLAAIRKLNRLELVAETLRAALNELATEAPEWLQALAPLAWYERYGRRIENFRLPQTKADREAYAQTVGEDGFCLLDALETAEAPAALRTLPSITTLRRTWHQHYERTPGEGVERRVRFKTVRELPQTAEKIESPYDVEARYRTKRDTQWTGYMVHVTETCEPEEVHLLTHVQTTTAAVHEVRCTEAIHQALVDKELPPRDHVVDAAYIDAALLVSSRDAHGIELLGPPRPNVRWQSQVAGAHTLEQFAVDWEQQQVQCPQGKTSATWVERVTPTGSPLIYVRFSLQDCGACATRALCTRSQQRARVLLLPPRAQYEALHAARARQASAAGQQRYARRAGIEGTLSQGVRAFGLRRSRYRGLAKTHVQHVATAAAINVERIVAWLDERPRAKTRTSRFAALAPAATLPPGEAAA